MRLERRPRHILALYIEARRLEVVRADRRRRSWQLTPAEQHVLPEGEPLFDYLSRLSLRPKAGHSTALIVILPRSYYSFGREYYPLTLQDRLEEALTFDWQENLFYDDELTLRFAASPAVGEQKLVVPIFSLSQEVYEKFQQALGASFFGSFTIVPSAMAYPAVFSGQSQGNGQPTMRMLARALGPSEMEVHRYLNGTVVDSFLIHRRGVTERLFGETMRALADNHQAEADGQPHIELLCSPAEEAGSAVRSWVENGLPIKTAPFDGALLSRLVEHLVNREQFKAFGAELRLKPWQPPRILLPLVLLLACYGALGAFQWYMCKRLAHTAIEVQAQRRQLEAQWRPIEQLQANIAKLKEQHKALAEFDQQSFPMYGLLNLLTQVTTEDTWLDFFSLTNKELQIRGESKSAAKYLSELSKVDGFTNVSFASPVSRNPSSDKERFNVRIQLEVERLRRTLDVKESGGTVDADESDASLEAPPVGVEPKAAPSVPEGNEAVPSSMNPEKSRVRRGNTLPKAQGATNGDGIGEPPGDEHNGAAEPGEVPR
jgi:Tfp pilus assembly protein PilN